MPTFTSTTVTKASPPGWTLSHCLQCCAAKCLPLVAPRGSSRTSLPQVGQIQRTTKRSRWPPSLHQPCHFRAAASSEQAASCRKSLLRRAIAFILTSVAAWLAAGSVTVAATMAGLAATARVLWRSFQTSLSKRKGRSRVQRGVRVNVHEWRVTQGGRTVIH